MKLLTLNHGGVFHPAVLIEDDALDLVAARDVIKQAHDIPLTMKELLAGGAKTLDIVKSVIDAAAEPETCAKLTASGAIVPFDSAKLGPAVPDPKILLAGSMNSYDHVAEMGDEPPTFPTAFQKAVSSICASGDEILLPTDHGEMVDWEGEFSVVIGKRCHKVSEAEALECIAGYTLVNDVSAREFAVEFKKSGPQVGEVAQAWERNVLGKSYPTFSPIGPVITTADEMPGDVTYRMETIVNGEVMQDSTQEDLVFNPAKMIEYFSKVVIFEPGDIITMGSPPGVGMARKPAVFLKPGDVVEVRSTGIGTLRNVVAATR